MIKTIFQKFLCSTPPDFGDDQYLDMICVEPGLLTDVPLLEGGKKASFTQTVKCVKD